jgi:hypothetical protein
VATFAFYPPKAVAHVGRKHLKQMGRRWRDSFWCLQFLSKKGLQPNQHLGS